MATARVVLRELENQTDPDKTKSNERADSRKHPSLSIPQV